MHSLIKLVGLQQALRNEGIPLVIAFAIAESFYKFHSFAWETLAFLATWYLLSGAWSALRAQSKG